MKPISRLLPKAIARIVPARPSKPSRLPIDIPAPDPLGHLDPTGDPEVDSAVELDAIQQGFRDRAKAEAERFKGATSTDYYTCLVFQSGDQVTEFLTALGVGGVDGDMFIDGPALAAKLGIELTAVTMPTRLHQKPDVKLARLTGIPKRR